MKVTFSDKIATLQPSAIREILKFTADPEVISFAAGNPAPEAFPTQKIAEISADILENNPVAALQYSLTEGYLPLRDTIKKMLKERYAIGQEYDDLMVVSGAQQGIELTCKVLCNEGDTVLCESPSFIGSLNSFRSYNVSLKGVEMEEDGIHMEKLEKALQENPHVRFLYVIPNFQNPSGITMSLEKRKAVYELAKKYGILILEDNPYGDLRFSGDSIPSIKSMDTKGIVVYCGSFSKILSPGLRVGYVSAHKEILSKLTVAKQCADVHTNVLAQMICDRFVKETDLDAHFSNLQQIYRKKCGLMIQEMEKCFPSSVAFTRPQGGLFLYCTLPQGADMMSFCETAVKNKVAVVPGTAFTTDEKEPTTSFRMNYSTPTDERIVQGVEILGKLLKAQF